MRSNTLWVARVPGLLGPEKYLRESTLDPPCFIGRFFFFLNWGPKIFLYKVREGFQKSCWLLEDWDGDGTELFNDPGSFVGS